MTDRELLELAAKAVGYVIDADRQAEREAHGFGNAGFWVSGVSTCWNPLTDDGDAFRLAAELRIDILFDGKDSPCAHVETVANLPGVREQPWAHEPLGDDQNAATRRAIVRAAAEIGRGIAQKVGSDLPEDNYYKTQAEAEEIGRAAEIGKVKP